MARRSDEHDIQPMEVSHPFVSSHPVLNIMLHQLKAAQRGNVRAQAAIAIQFKKATGYDQFVKFEELTLKKVGPIIPAGSIPKTPRRKAPALTTIIKDESPGCSCDDRCAICDIGDHHRCKHCTYGEYLRKNW